MSTPEKPRTVTVTYPGPHPAVYVPGTPDLAKAGEPVEVEAGLAQTLVNQGWTSDTLTTQETAAGETAEEPVEGDTATEPEATETATAPAGTEQIASDPVAGIAVNRRR